MIPKAPWGTLGIYFSLSCLEKIGKKAYFERTEKSPFPLRASFGIDLGREKLNKGILDNSLS